MSRVKEPPMITDPTLVRIGQGVELHHGQGEREAARDVLAQLIKGGLDRLTQLLTPK
jgi:hypothetical protein